MPESVVGIPNGAICCKLWPKTMLCWAFENGAGFSKMGLGFQKWGWVFKMGLGFQKRGLYTDCTRTPNPCPRIVRRFPGLHAVAHADSPDCTRLRTWIPKKETINCKAKVPLSSLLNQVSPVTLSPGATWSYFHYPSPY